MRLIPKSEMLDRVGVSYPTVWRWMRDGSFPRGVAVGTRTFWRSDEIDAWIAALPLRRLKGDSQLTHS